MFSWIKEQYYIVVYITQNVFHFLWLKLVHVAELDVLISLAIASEYYEGPTSRPIILDSSSSDEVPCFSAKSLGHPVLRSDSLGKGTFVPNEIIIGGSGHANFILLTGPNMGGKSTPLLQVCLAVFLAQVMFLWFLLCNWVLFCGFHLEGSFQVGADVPADSFELSPVDRIFVRMGAKDHIMAGQSTFLTELSETALMLVRFVSGSKDFHCTLLLCLWFYRLFVESKTTFLVMYKLISLPILVLIFSIIN